MAASAGQAVLVCRRDFDCGACVMGCTGGEACGGWHAPGATNLIKAAIKKIKGKEWWSVQWFEKNSR